MRETSGGGTRVFRMPKGEVGEKKGVQVALSLGLLKRIGAKGGLCGVVGGERAPSSNGRKVLKI